MLLIVIILTNARNSNYLNGSHLLCEVFHNTRRRKARGSFATISVVWPHFTATSSLIREPIADGYAGSSGATTSSADDVRTKV